MRKRSRCLGIAKIEGLHYGNMFGLIDENLARTTSSDKPHQDHVDHIVDIDSLLKCSIERQIYCSYTPNR